MFKSLFDFIRGYRDEGFDNILNRTNSKSHEDVPVSKTAMLGVLDFPSCSLTIEDPQNMPDGLVISQLASNHATFEAELLQYPDNSVRVKTLRISFTDIDYSATPQTLYEMGTEDGKIVIADTDDVRKHWSETGPDRLGVISTARNQKLLRQLKKRFSLNTLQINGLRAEITEPVTEELEQNIIQYIESTPEFAELKFMHFLFYVQTNNSFERINFMETEWQFLPIGNEPQPTMFTCDTAIGGGGEYNIQGIIKNNVVQSIFINFIELVEH